MDTAEKQRLGELLANDIEGNTTDNTKDAFEISEKRMRDFNTVLDDIPSIHNITRRTQTTRKEGDKDDQQFARRLIQQKGIKDQRLRLRLESVIEYGCAVDFDALQDALVTRISGVSTRVIGFTPSATIDTKNLAVRATCAYVEALLAMVLHRPLVDYAYRRVPAPFHNDSTRDALCYLWPVTFGLLHASEVGLFAASKNLR